jgi:ApaG protein
VTSKFRVSVSTEYLAAQSQPEQDQYAFSYHITISNMGVETGQLISRHWIITDGNGAKKEVRGLGVVGEQPVILPGESFHYTSFSVLETNVGTMEGSYQMQAPDNSLYDVAIEPFLLAVPGAIN